MTLKILTKLSDDSKPVINAKPLRANQIRIEDFKGELSSTTGIYSKGLFIAKLDKFEGSTKVESPTVTIISEHYFHIDKKAKPIIKGTYGKSYSKCSSFTPLPNDDNEDHPYFRIDAD